MNDINNAGRRTHLHVDYDRLQLFCDSNPYVDSYMLNLQLRALFFGSSPYDNYISLKNDDLLNNTIIDAIMSGKTSSTDFFVTTTPDLVTIELINSKKLDNITIPETVNTNVEIIANFTNNANVVSKTNNKLYLNHIGEEPVDMSLNAADIIYLAGKYNNVNINAKTVTGITQLEYKFNNIWKDSEGNIFSELPNVIKDEIYYAYSIDEETVFKVTFELNNGSEPIVINVKYGEIPLIEEPTFEGYVFDSWSEKIVPATSDMTYVAKYIKNNIVATITDNSGNIIEFTSFDNVMDSITADSTIKLYKDITLTASPKFGVNAILDLNGCTITRTGTNIAIIVNQGATLTINDSKGTGKILLNTSYSGVTSVIKVNGTLIVNGGQFIATQTSTNTSYSAVAIHLDSANSAVYIYDGIFNGINEKGSGYAIYHNDSTSNKVYIYGGKFEASTRIIMNSNINKDFIYGGYYTKSLGTTVAIENNKELITLMESDAEYNEGYRYTIRQNTYNVIFVDYDGNILENAANIDNTYSYNDELIYIPIVEYAEIYGDVKFDENLKTTSSVSAIFKGDNNIVYSGELNIDIVSKNEEPISINIYAPNATVMLTGEFDNVKSNTADNTLILNKNTKILTLDLKHGNIKVDNKDMKHGNINSANNTLSDIVKQLNCKYEYTCTYNENDIK